jgi:hypothetical protein
MSIIQFLEPPCDIDDVLHINFSMNNLHKFLNFLLLSDKEAYSKLNDISGKLSQIDEIKVLIKENTQKMYLIEDKFVEIDKVLHNFNIKFNDVNEKFLKAFQVKKFLNQNI